MMDQPIVKIKGLKFELGEIEITTDQNTSPNVILILSEIKTQLEKLNQLAKESKL